MHYPGGGGGETLGETRTKIKFWKDVWIGEISLKDKYPRIYNNSNQKDVKIAKELE